MLFIEPPPNDECVRQAAGLENSSEAPALKMKLKYSSFSVNSGSLPAPNFAANFCNFVHTNKHQPQRGTSNRKTLFSASILRFLTSFRVVGYWRRFFVVAANMEKAAEIIAKGVNTELSSSSFGVDLPIGNISRFKKLELLDFFVSFCAIYESLSGSFFSCPAPPCLFCYVTFLFSAAFREPLFANLVSAKWRLHSTPTFGQILSCIGANGIVSG